MMIQKLFSRQNGALVFVTGTNEDQMDLSAGLMNMTPVANFFLDYNLWWWNGENLVSRPEIPPPPTFVANTEVEWNGLKEGTIIDIFSVSQDNPVGSIIVGETESVLFGLTFGLWRIQVRENFPYKPAVFDIQVT